MSIAYIRKTYGVAFKIGDTVSIRKGCGSPMDGLTGKLVSAKGSYLSVKGKTWRGSFHPSNVEQVTTGVKT